MAWCIWRVHTGKPNGQSGLEGDSDLRNTVKSSKHNELHGVQTVSSLRTIYLSCLPASSASFSWHQLLLLLIDCKAFTTQATRFCTRTFAIVLFSRHSVRRQTFVQHAICLLFCQHQREQTLTPGHRVLSSPQRASARTHHI